MTDFPQWCLAKLPQQGPWQIQPMGEQLSNRTWQISNGQQRYFVKQYFHDLEFGRDSHAMMAIERFFADLDMAPKLIFVSLLDGLVVYEFLASNLIDNVPKVELRIRVLARALAGVHHQKPNINTPSLRARLHAYCDTLEVQKPKDAQRMREDIMTYDGLLKKAAQGPTVFCHHDLSTNHVFLTPHLKIIDSEYAGYNHPGVALAMCVVINDLYEEEIDWFFEEYNQHAPFPLKREDLPDWLRLVAFVNYLWFKVQALLEPAEA